VLGSGTTEGTNKYSPPLSALALPGAVLPGYGKPWPGTYETYRAMSAHPTLALAIVATMAPVVACEWTVEETKGKAPSEAREFISDLMLPMRVRILWECLKSTVFGCRQFEQVLEVDGGYMSLKRLKPLLPELTEIRVDEHGHFAGLTQGNVTLEADRAFVCAHDRDGDDYYGRSRHENCRRVWTNALAIEDNLYRLSTKASSIIPRVGFPPAGKVVDETGKQVSSQDQARKMAAGMSRGAAVVYPNLAGLEIDDLRGLPDLVKGSLWKIDTIDMGDSGPALVAILKTLQYYDMLMVRGWLKPERSILEAQKSGSRADSESHGDIATSDCDMLHGQIVEQINDQVIDNLLVQNFGEAARGTVRLAAVPLADEQRLLDQKLLDAILNNPQALPDLVDHIDMDSWLDRTGYPRNQLRGQWDGMMAPPANVDKPPADNDGIDDPAEPEDPKDPLDDEQE
jgi:hypothetical protein